MSILALAACATTGATLGSGVGDAFPERPPYYAGASLPADSVQLAHLPIMYQRGGADSPIFDPAGGANTPVAALLAEMNVYLDSLAGSVRLEAAAEGVPPDVRFGCEEDLFGECSEEDGEALGRRNRFKLSVGRPSASWAAATRAAMERAGAGRALVVTLEIGEYRVRQSGLRGNKSVELGTAHTVELPWLTSLETPVSVAQLTGAIVDSTGRALRIGAEGMLARRTSLLVSAIGGQALITDEDIERLRTARRDELPGRPLVWQVALKTLVAQLTGARVGATAP
jgi:hypothetical protein